jgi:hypothetical protein
MSSAQIPTLTNADAKFDASDEKNLGVEHGDNTNRYEAGLSGAQSQYCSFGAILVGYDGTVSRFSVSEAHIA